MIAIGAIRRTNMSATLARIAIASTALACTRGVVPASAADFVMKFGTATINETQHQFIKFYKDEVEKASNGRIEVQIYPASQLGPIPREIEGVQLGNIQGYIGPVDFFVGVDPRFGVFSAPMLFRDEPNAAATVHRGALVAAIDPSCPRIVVRRAASRRSPMSGHPLLENSGVLQDKASVAVTIRPWRSISSPSLRRRFC